MRTPKKARRAGRASKDLAIPATTLYKLFCEANAAVTAEADAIAGLGKWLGAVTSETSASDPVKLAEAAAVMKALAAAVIVAAGCVLSKAETLQTLADVRLSDIVGDRESAE